MTQNLSKEMAQALAQEAVSETTTDPSSTAVPTQETPESQAIKALQSELENVKAVLKSLETKPQQPSVNNVKMIVANDFNKIDRMVSLGAISAAQGSGLKQQVLQKAFDNASTTQPAQHQPAQAISQVITEFEKANPDSFASDARKMLKDYITSGFETISAEELSKIMTLVKTLEDNAINAYEESKLREKTMTETNEEAKKRLASTALTAAKGSGATGKVFTREEIGKMSTDEFRKNESEIMAQLRKGQIK